MIKILSFCAAYLLLTGLAGVATAYISHYTRKLAKA
jgi:hypothetical protein